MANRWELIDRAIELDRQAKVVKVELDGIKAKLQTDALAEMENKGTKYVEYFGSSGSAVVCYKDKFEVDNLPWLKEIFGEVLTGKIKTEETVKVTLDKKVQAAVVALYKNDYAIQDLDKVLAGMGLELKQIKAVRKKLKGEYAKDLKTLQSFGVDVGDGCEEELDAIRHCINHDLIMKYIDPAAVDREKLKRAVSVEESLAIGLNYDDGGTAAGAETANE